MLEDAAACIYAMVLLYGVRAWTVEWANVHYIVKSSLRVSNREKQLECLQWSACMDIEHAAAVEQGVWEKKRGLRKQQHEQQGS
eukprot:1160396-Pelagomonas_calceolata.AAC.4